MVSKASGKKKCCPNSKRILLKIRLSIRVRNFAAPNEPLNIKKNYFNPKVVPLIETLWKKSSESERLKISHLGTFSYLFAVFITDIRTVTGKLKGCRSRLALVIDTAVLTTKKNIVKKILNWRDPVPKGRVGFFDYFRRSLLAHFE
jgi:hypothetical protein